MTDPAQTAKPADTQRKAECSRCGGVRNCDILGTYSEPYEDTAADFQGNTDWHILKCRGCDYVFVQTVQTNSEDYVNYYEEDGSTGTTYNETIKYWPALSKRKKPDWMDGLSIEDDDGLTRALLEVYEALEHDLRMLAAIGIRTAFDIASGLLGIDANLSFEDKLDELVHTGKIGSVDKERLGMLIEAGNASAHRGWRPKPNELNTMMDILEHFVQETWVTPQQKKQLNDDAAKVKKTVPPRPPRVKKKKVTSESVSG